MFLTETVSTEKNVKAIEKRARMFKLPSKVVSSGPTIANAL